VRKLVERLSDCRPDSVKYGRRDMRVAMIVKKGSSAEVRVGPIYPVIIKEGFPAHALVPHLPVLGVGFMDKYRVSECRTVREPEKVHVVVVCVSAKDRAYDRSCFPFLPGVFSRGGLGINVVPPLRSLAAMHLLLNIFLQVPEKCN
jgi:hypothetical protein